MLVIEIHSQRREHATSAGGCLFNAWSLGAGQSPSPDGDIIEYCETGR